MHRRDRSTPPRHVTGVTLIELLAVIAIAAILMAIGVPSYRYIQNASRVDSEANGLLNDLEFARAEAIKEGQTVTVCVSTDGATCNTATTAWQNGWIVFSDVNDDQSVDTGDTILRVARPFTGTDSFDSNPALGAVTFSREGFALALGGADTITLHDATSNPVWTRCLDMTVIGMMSVTNHSETPSCT